MECELKDQVIEFFEKIVSYSINLYEYAQLYKIPVYVNGNLNKGWKGNVIEHMLNLSSNNKKGSDYETLEIKTVPVIKKDNKIIVKETTCLSVIDMDCLLKKSFQQSDLYNKIKKTLFVLIDISEKENPHIDSTFYLDFSHYPLLVDGMEKDYNNLVEHILDNISNDNHMDKNFSGKLGDIIQPRPKTGKKGQYCWAFYMKKNVLENFLNPKSTAKLKI